VILHCADGNRSGNGAALLRKNGFASVVNLSRRLRRLAAGRPAGGKEIAPWSAC
jgi:rhodanese-related sulfurtransferase